MREHLIPRNVNCFSERRANSSRLRLFCFPYAGGGTWIFRSWQEIFPDSIEILPVELPGRGRRYNEPLITDMKQMIELLASELQPHFDLPFAFFGHSMGARIGFELASELQHRCGPSPVHLFVSGATPRDEHRAEQDIHTLPLSEFLERVNSLNGTPEYALKDPELVNVIVPLLRSDFALNNSAVRSLGPLCCPISAFIGSHDPEVTLETASQWRIHTLSNFQLMVFPGDHFFIQTSQRGLLRAIVAHLAEYSN